jgi:DNA-binding NtrC family response regulator
MKQAPVEELKKRRGRPLANIDRETLQVLFKENGGVAQKVAKALNVSARALYYKINELGLSLEDLRRK